MFHPRPSGGVSHIFFKSSNKTESGLKSDPPQSLASSGYYSKTSEVLEVNHEAFSAVNRYASPAASCANSEPRRGPAEDNRPYSDMKRSSPPVNKASGSYSLDNAGFKLENSVPSVYMTTKGIFDRNFLVKLLLTFERMLESNSIDRSRLNMGIAESLKFRFVEATPSTNHTYVKDHPVVSTRGNIINAPESPNSVFESEGTTMKKLLEDNLGHRKYYFDSHRGALGRIPNLDHTKFFLDGRTNHTNLKVMQRDSGDTGNENLKRMDFTGYESGNAISQGNSVWRYSVSDEMDSRAAQTNIVKNRSTDPVRGIQYADKSIPMESAKYSQSHEPGIVTPENTVLEVPRRPFAASKKDSICDSVSMKALGLKPFVSHSDMKDSTVFPTQIAPKYLGDSKLGGNHRFISGNLNARQHSAQSNIQQAWSTKHSNPSSNSVWKTQKLMSLGKEEEAVRDGQRSEGYVRHKNQGELQQSYLERLFDKQFDSNESAPISNVMGKDLDSFSPVCGFDSVASHEELQTATRNDSESTLNLQWQYMDPHGIVHGPFSSKQMYRWYLKNFFPPGLCMRYTSKMPWTPFKELYPPSSSPFREIPQGFRAVEAALIRGPEDSCHPHIKPRQKTQKPLQGDIGSTIERENIVNSVNDDPVINSSSSKPVVEEALELRDSQDIISQPVNAMASKEFQKWDKLNELKVDSLFQIMENQKQQSEAAAAAMAKADSPIKKPASTSGWNFEDKSDPAVISEDFPTLGASDSLKSASKQTRIKTSLPLQHNTTVPLKVFMERHGMAHDLVPGRIQPNQTFASKIMSGINTNK